MNRETVYLAALLHDIGKFWQRADKKRLISDNLNSVTHSLTGYMCPIKDNGSFGYQHVVWTHQFFENFSDVFNRVIISSTGLPAFKVNPFTEGNYQDNLVNLSVFHHYPATRLQALIQLADWWSSGIDRREENMETEADVMPTSLQYGAAKFKKVPLHSLFSEIVIEGKKGSMARYQLNALNIDDNHCFYAKKFGQSDIEDLSDEYELLWSKFSAEMANLPTNSVDGFLESLLFLLKKYTWCIPASTNDMAYVGLYEHLKSCAAFADCFYVYHEQFPEHFSFDENKKRLSIKKGKCPVLMLCGDISGIQNFIYNVASAKASVSLKGRSFYLQLIIETVTQHLNMETGTNAAHIIYSSGGKFYMVLPNTPQVVAKLETAREVLTKKIWEEQKMKLFLCLDWIPFCLETEDKQKGIQIFSEEKTSEGFEITTLNQLWKAVSDKAASRKGRKYEMLLNEQYEMFFGSNNKGLEIGEKHEVCAVTGEESKELVFLDEQDSDSIKVLKVVREQVQLGKKLKDADFILTHKYGEERESRNYKLTAAKINPLVMNYRQYLFDQKELMKEDAEFRIIPSADTSRIRVLNTTDFLWYNKLKGQQVSYGFLFYGGNKQALLSNSNEPKTFYDLARNDNGEPTYLGVLRMDVDGLGALFQKGIPEHLRTFAAYSMLSTALDYFFSGRLNVLRNQVEYKDWVNIIYSGGDDLFVVGRWAEVIKFAADVRNEFRAFIGGREDISISAGIAFMHEKFPISLGAAQAGEAEKVAKNYFNMHLQNIGTTKAIPTRKNSICFFGEAVSWHYEFEWVSKKKEVMLKLYYSGKVTKGFIHKLIDLKLNKDFMIQMQKQENELNKNDYSYRWNAAYYLARYQSRFDKGKPENIEVINLLETLKTYLFDQSIGDDRYFDLIALAARWAEFHIKENIK